LILDKAFFNGYSYIIKCNKVEFSINKYEKNLMVKIYQAILSDKNDQKYKMKNIYIGDKIYTRTRIEENNEESFKINEPTKDGIITYLFTFMTEH